MSIFGRKCRKTRKWHLTVPKPELNTSNSNRVLLGMGSSLGDRRLHLQKGLLLLAYDSSIDLVSLSSVWETMPIGAAKNAFYNLCVCITTSYSPQELLSRLLEIEKKCERLRGVHWMDRTLDLDILLYENHIVDEPILKIPHPRIVERAFVMVPGIEIAAEWIHPIHHDRLEQLNTHSENGMWRVGCFSIAHKN